LRCVLPRPEARSRGSRRSAWLTRSVCRRWRPSGLPPHLSGSGASLRYIRFANSANSQFLRPTTTLLSACSPHPRNAVLCCGSLPGATCRCSGSPLGVAGQRRPFALYVRDRLTWRSLGQLAALVRLQPCRGSMEQMRCALAAALVASMCVLVSRVGVCWSLALVGGRDEGALRLVCGGRISSAG
jgi:hypothetical protein